MIEREQVRRAIAFLGTAIIEEIVGREQAQREEAEIDRVEDRRAAECDLAYFVRAAWPLYETRPFLHNWHIDLVADHVQACYQRQIKRLIINFPPRMMKSGIVTICAPCWWWTRDPGERFVFASYSNALSLDHSMARRRIILSEWYQSHWNSRDGDSWVQLSRDQQEKSEFHSTIGGKMVASSVGASITGKGSNVIVVDDLLNPEQAESETERLRANNFFDQTLYSRLDDKINGIIMVVMQRLHEDDLTGHLLKTDRSWTLLKIPVQPGSTTTYHFLTRRCKPIVRHPGQLMWPAREGPEQVKSAKIRLGSRAFAGQYQQEPTPFEGNILKREWLERAMWTHHDLPHNDRGEIEFEWIGQYWDMSFKDPGQSIQKRRQAKQIDYVAGAAFGVKGPDIFMLYLIRARMTKTAPSELREGEDCARDGLLSPQHSPQNRIILAGNGKS